MPPYPRGVVYRLGALVNLICDRLTRASWCVARYKASYIYARTGEERLHCEAFVAGLDSNLRTRTPVSDLYRGDIEPETRGR